MKKVFDYIAKALSVVFVISLIWIAGSIAEISVKNKSPEPTYTRTNFFQIMESLRAE